MLLLKYTYINININFIIFIRYTTWTMSYLINQLYKTYNVGRSLVDKTAFMYTHPHIEHVQPIRIFNDKSTVVDHLYNLYYEPTHICSSIYLGNSVNARSFSSLKELNVGLIVNVTEEIPNYYVKDFDYIQIPISDTKDANIYPYLDTVAYQIDNYIHTYPHKTVLVHCFMGASRSASIVIAYLIRFYRMTFTEALYFCKEKRHLINLNVDFCNQLIKYDMTLN